MINRIISSPAVLSVSGDISQVALEVETLNGKSANSRQVAAVARFLAPEPSDHIAREILAIYGYGLSEYRL